MAKPNGSLNGWARLVFVALLASGGTTAGNNWFGKPQNTTTPIVTPEQWTEIHVKLATVTTTVAAQTIAIGKLEKAVSEVVRLIHKH